MKKSLKKITAVVLCIIMISGFVPLSGLAELDLHIPELNIDFKMPDFKLPGFLSAFTETASAAETVSSGTCGNNVTWTLDDEGTLTISGTGAMANYGADSAPWVATRSTIKNIVIEDGITDIGNYAFYNCSTLTSIDIPDGVTSIGSSVFENCSDLTSIGIPGSVTYVNYSVFRGCTELEKCNYSGTIAQWCKINFVSPYSNPFYANSKCKLSEDNSFPSEIKASDFGEVTSINSYAFCNASDITDIELPDSVTSIGSYAFYGCSGLTSIDIPAGVTSIGGSAFYCCSGLTSIDIPDSVTVIGLGAFRGCSGLTNVILPDGLKSIDESVFNGCSGLTDVNIPDSVTVIGYESFCNCSGLTSINIPDGVTTIKHSAFYGCRSLKSIDIPDSVTSIDTYAFYGCSDLESVNLGTGITKISSQTFESCESLKSLTLPDNVTSIGYQSFSGCSSLTSVDISAGVTSIGDYAFYGCSSLTSIDIPAGVTSIGDYAFYGCSGLTSIDIPAGVTSIESCTFYGCSGLTNIDIPDGVTSIGTGAFYGCSDLTSVDIPDSVTSIGDGAFHGCSGLTGIDIPDGVTSIGTDALRGCSGLTSIDIPDSVTSIGAGAFWSCSGLTNVDIPDSVTSIGASAFFDCSGLTSIDIPAGVTSIGASAFQNCSGLSSIDIPDSVTVIGSYAFSGCSCLTSIDIPDGVTSIGTSAFYNCSGLTSVDIPDGVTSIESGTFYRCSGLTSIDIPDGVTVIGSYAFSYCSGLTSVDIPDGVTSIGDRAFLGCSGLTSIDIPDSVTEIGDFAFQKCSGLKNVTIPDSVTYISDSTFYNCSNLKSITIPDSITGIGKSAFFWCFNLENVYFLGSQSEWNNLINGSDFGTGNDCLLKANVICDQSCGRNMRFDFDSETGMLSLIGSGETYNYASAEEAPWYGYKDQIKSVSVGEGITCIGDYLFSELTNVETITLPDSLTSIGENTFSECSSLSMVSIGSGLESIDKSLFSDCSALSGITVSSDNPAYSSADGVLFSKDATELIYYPLGMTDESYTISAGAVTISENAFSGNPCLKSIRLDNSVTTVESDAFSALVSLETVTYAGTRADWKALISSDTFAEGNGNLTSAQLIYTDYICGDNLTAEFSEATGTLTISGSGEMYDFTSSSAEPWNDCLDAVTEIVFSGDIISIGTYAFADCKELEKITIPASVKSIGEYAFSNCTSLGSVTVPEGVTEISRSVFENCTSLESVTIPSTVTSIGEKVFSDCINLTTVSLPDGLQSIGDSAFVNCRGLVSVDTGDNITHIGRNAFRNTAFYNYPRNYDNKLLYLDEDYKYLIVCGDDSISQSFNGKINSRTVLIADGAFENADIDSLTLNDSLEYMGSEIFAGTDITELDIPASVLSAEQDTLAGCESLKTVNYGSNRLDWIGLNISFDGDVYYTLESDDGRAIVIYCDADVPDEAGNIEINGAPEVEVNDVSASDSQLRNSSFYNKDSSHIYDDINISLQNKYGVIQPLDGKTVTLKIKVSDELKELILNAIKAEYPQYAVNFDTVSIKDGKVKFTVGSQVYEIAADKFASEKRFRLYHWYSDAYDDNFDGKDEIYIAYGFKDMELEDGYIILAVPHFSEFAMSTEEVRFLKDEYSVISGNSVTVETNQNSGTKVTYVSSDESKATVDADGNVTGISNGTVTITAMVDGIEAAECKVTVTVATIGILGYRAERTVDCKQTIIFSSEGTLPEGATVHWYVNGNEKGTGNSITVSSPTDDYTIMVKAFDKSGNQIAQSETEKVNVKHGFFDKLIAFFRSLFGGIKAIEQK